MNPAWIAVDIGAESGRVIRGELADGLLKIEEVHRFPNTPKGDRWDLEMLVRETKAGINKAGTALSVGVDTWAVDYVFIGDEPKVNPYQYRHPKNVAAFHDVVAQRGKWEIYSRTGVQFLPFNTLYQLHTEESRQLASGAKEDGFLMIPDYIHYELTGRSHGARVVEWTNALTTQMYNPVDSAWENRLLNHYFMTSGINTPVVSPGTELGQYVGMDVIAPCTHDTSSAIVAVPSSDENCAWISSGTWSIIGTTVDQPVITREAMELNFTNEGMYGKRFRLCKNCAGMWLIQQCRAAWGGQDSYAELAKLAEEAESIPSHFDPDLPDFLPTTPAMPDRILAALDQSSLPHPQGKGQMVRLILESLALKYRMLVEQTEQLSGRKLDSIHVVGGGCQNDLLNQLTADICNRSVIAGPVEATAIGNIIVQMISTGHLSTLNEGREFVKKSFETRTFLPQNSQKWDPIYAEFRKRIS